LTLVTIPVHAQKGSITQMQQYHQRKGIWQNRNTILEKMKSFAKDMNF
jgi:hypothetical protein